MCATLLGTDSATKSKNIYGAKGVVSLCACSKNFARHDLSLCQNTVTSVYYHGQLGLKEIMYVDTEKINIIQGNIELYKTDQ